MTGRVNSTSIDDAYIKASQFPTSHKLIISSTRLLLKSTFH